MIVTGKGWLVQSLDSLLEGVAGLERFWLHASEMAQVARFRSEERRRSWIGGRVAAKQLLLSQLPLAIRCPREIQIVSRRTGHLGHPPVAEFGDRLPPRILSISHTGRIVSVAIALETNTRAGIDVVELADVDERRLAYWLASSEIAWSRRSDVSVAEIWAAKEAAFKTLPCGGPFRPRRCIIGDGVGWSFLACEKGVRYTGSVRTWRSQEIVIALAERSLGEPASACGFKTRC